MPTGPVTKQKGRETESLRQGRASSEIHSPSRVPGENLGSRQKVCARRQAGLQRLNLHSYRLGCILNLPG